MVTRQTVDAYARAVRQRDAARAELYGESPSAMEVPEFVPSLGKLREIAQAVGKSTYETNDYQGMEAVDHGGVHFFAVNGKVM